MGELPWLAVTLSVSLTSLSSPALCGRKTEMGTELGDRDVPRLRLGTPQGLGPAFSFSACLAQGRAQEPQTQGPHWLWTSEEERSGGQAFAKCLSCQRPLFTLSALENDMSGVGCSIFMAL